MANNQDYNEKLISGYTTRKYLKCSKAEFEKLVKQGAIHAFRDEANRWRVSKESVLNYMKPSLSSKGTHLIINNDHYLEIVQRICDAKSSIKMLTGDFKRFNLKPTAKQGKNYKDGTPFVKYLMEKAVQGVPVQVICSEPSKTFLDDKDEYYEQLNQPEFFEFKHCIRNHAKAIIIDDKLAYVGSANITPAGIGQGIFTPGNFETGILSDDPAIVTPLKELFSKIWAGSYCVGCHRAEKCLEI